MNLLNTAIHHAFSELTLFIGFLCRDRSPLRTAGNFLRRRGHFIDCRSHLVGFVALALHRLLRTVRLI